MLKYESKAQVAMEFILLVAVALIVSGIFFLLNYSSQTESIEEREYDALTDLGYSVRTELYTATAVSDGYLRIFELPHILDNRNYTINVTGDVIQLQGVYSEVSLQVPPFTGDVQKGTNVLTRENGQLYLN